ncbi:MAG: acyl-CoA--6-aminopenicillanic acid acyltransferase [Firmicutes bacterium]|nr:acyl-CoA--6-aminopenicillanic acid acyltransferase [Bacillota bacterium]
MNFEYPFYEVSGDTYFDVGKCYGMQAKEKIGLAIENYKDFFGRHNSDRTWDEFREYAMGYVPYLEDYGPELLEQVRGIAAGSGFAFEDIMILNTRYEITKLPSPECTTACILPEASGNGHTYLVKNWDFREGVRDFLVKLHYTLPNGTRIIGTTEAGQLPRDGMNSNRVAMANNSTSSTLDYYGAGIPVTFIRMKVLSASSYEEALEVYLAATRSCTNNSLIATVGQVRSYEAYPDGHRLKEPIGGIVTHANHLELRPEINKYPISQRSDRLNKLLLERYQKIDVEAIKQVMSDHKDLPESICAHPGNAAQPLGDRKITVQSIIYDIDDLNVHIADGPPCETKFTTYKV